MNLEEDVNRITESYKAAQEDLQELKQRYLRFNQTGTGLQLENCCTNSVIAAMLISVDNCLTHTKTDVIPNLENEYVGTDPRYIECYKGEVLAAKRILKSIHDYMGLYNFPTIEEMHKLEIEQHETEELLETMHSVADVVIEINDKEV